VLGDDIGSNVSWIAWGILRKRMKGTFSKGAEKTRMQSIKIEGKPIRGGLQFGG